MAIVACKEEEAKKDTLAPEVQIVAVGKQNVYLYSEYVGQTYGQSDVNIQSRTQGWITSMNFKEGSLVQKGSLLYTIDDLPAKTRIDAAESNLARAKTMMENKKADLNRIKPLAEMNALSQRDLDAATAAYQSALSEVQIAESQLTNAKIELGYTRITAPITGIIGISKVQVGDYVGGTAIGMGFNTISSLGDVRVRFPISESEYLRFSARARTDQGYSKLSEVPVELILGDGSIYGEKGKLDLTNRQIDAETGSLLIQAIFKNTQGIIKPGQYVKVRIRTDELKDATLIPQQAVNQLQDLYQVFFLTDSNTLKPVMVKAGVRVGSNWIIKEGLKPGDKIAVIGNSYIKPGVAVRPVDMKWNYDSTSKN
ncbi:MAG: efflux RND transporter periplasmic adaptor subunit [Chitinophagales bacterium]